MNLIRFVKQIGVDAELAVTTLLKEVDRDLRELSVAEDVLLLLDILRNLSAQLLKLRLQEIGGAALDGSHIADDLLAELGVDRHGSGAVFAGYQILELGGAHLVTFTHNDVEHRLGADDL